MEKSIVPYRDGGSLGSLKGKMSENNLCVDCGVNTAPGLPTRIEAEIAFTVGAESIPMRVGKDTEMYMVHDKVWEKAGMEG